MIDFYFYTYTKHTSAVLCCVVVSPRGMPRVRINFNDALRTNGL
jgi:hypothetical protein